MLLVFVYNKQHKKDLSFEQTKFAPTASFLLFRLFDLEQKKKTYHSETCINGKKLYIVKIDVKIF